MPKTRAAQRPAELSEAILHTNLTLIEVADPLLLDELKADRRLGAMIVAQLSDRVAVVKPEDRARFLQQLFRAGHTPKVIEV